MAKNFLPLTVLATLYSYERNRLSNFINAALLILFQVEFDMFLSYEEYNELTKKNEILMNFLIEAEEKVKRDASINCRHFSMKCCWSLGLSQLLFIPPVKPISCSRSNLQSRYF